MNSGEEGEKEDEEELGAQRRRRETSGGEFGGKVRKRIVRVIEDHE